MAPVSKLRNSATRLNDTLWSREVLERGRSTRLTASALRLVVAVSRDIGEGHLTLRATSLVYTTLLSLVPLLALSFAVLQGFGVQDMLEPFLRALFSPLGGEQSRDIAEKIAAFVGNMQVGVLGVLGLLMLVYSVIALMTKIESAFNDIWRVRRARPVLLRLRDYLSVFMIGPVLLFVSVALTTAVDYADSLERLFGLPVPHAAAEMTARFTGLMLFTLAFTALYMFMPYTRVRLYPALAAGAVTTVLWKMLGVIFAFFVASSASYAAIYSAFATLLLLFIWIYAGWFVVLLGASICYYLQNPSNQRLSRKGRSLSIRVKEKVALQVCALVAAAFYKEEPAPDIGALSAALSLPAAAVEEVAERLQKAGILAATGPYGRVFIPGRPFDDLTAADMMEALRAAEEEKGVGYGDMNAGAKVEAVLAAADKARNDALSRTKLKQLVEEEPSR